MSEVRFLFKTLIKYFQAELHKLFTGFNATIYPFWSQKQLKENAIVKCFLNNPCRKMCVLFSSGPTWEAGIGKNKSDLRCSHIYRQHCDCWLNPLKLCLYLLQRHLIIFECSLGYNGRHGDLQKLLLQWDKGQEAGVEEPQQLQDSGEAEQHWNMAVLTTKTNK